MQRVEEMPVYDEVESRGDDEGEVGDEGEDGDGGGGPPPATALQHIREVHKLKPGRRKSGWGVVFA